MTRVATAVPSTLTAALEATFKRALRTPEGVMKPVVLLWTDPDGSWRPLVSRLKAVLPQLYQLGGYDPAARTGPVIWLKCVVDRSIAEVAPPTGTVPILYLPRVDRQLLRAGGDCPAQLQPLIELQYRGEVWRQRNGRDWTVEAFITSNDGLGLDVAGDNVTRAAMLRTLGILADTNLDSLRGRRLDESDFNALAVSDPVRDVLLWIADPDGFRAATNHGHWEAFRAVCKATFQFDPEETHAPQAASKLAGGYGQWENVWRRFCESPRLYRGVAHQLRDPLAAPQDLLVEPSRQPMRNDEAEVGLREALALVANLPQSQACDRVLALENGHGERRGWVWAELGESQFALVLAPLSRLAALARSPIGGGTIEAVASAYASGGWRTDRAAIEALALAAKWTARDCQLVSQLVRVLYEPWLDASARRLQELVGQRPDGLRGLVSATPADLDTCVVFADGLRFDAGMLVQEKLDGLTLRTRLTHRIAPLPTVTATAKPVAAPLIDAFNISSPSGDFNPILTGNGQSATAPRVRDALARADVDVLERDTPRPPVGAARGGWVEVGQFDTLGHQRSVGLAAQFEDEVDRMVQGVTGLLDAGWTRVRVVTDHGWLLLPGGLPRVDLLPSLTATKWSRCAEVKGNSATEMPTYPWHWNAQVRIACPWGIAAFIAGNEYAHGGVSLQECVVPELLVERVAPKSNATIRTVEWRGMRCRVTVDGGTPSVRVDLRRNRKQPSSSLVSQSKELGTRDEVSLVVQDDANEGVAAAVVLLDPQDNLLDFKPTTVGEA